MTRRGIAVLLAAVVVSGCAATPSASAREKPSAHSLGEVLTKTERKAYRCGPRWREDRPVRAFVTKPHERFRLVPRRLLHTREHVVVRCAFARPHAVRAISPAAAPDPAVAAPSPPPVVAPAPAKTSTCRDEIGPSVAPASSGISIADPALDPYAPAPYPYDLATTWNSGGLTVDDAGHVRWQGVYVHPVAAAQYGLAALQEYRVSGDETWLHRAETAVSDSLATAGPDGLIPQDYPWTNREGDLFAAPAYSAMTQGQTLSLVVRLYEETGDQRWRDWADRLFATLTEPGVTFVDTDGYLWLEEYSTQCPGRVLNGHLFAVFGLVDYYRLTADPRAAAVFDAAATTVLHYMPDIRRVGGRSYYGVSQPFVNAFYHPVHIAQLRDMAAITGDQAFSDWADLLALDAS